jgi:hypothetical protein
MCQIDTHVGDISKSGTSQPCGGGYCLLVRGASILWVIWSFNFVPKSGFIEVVFIFAVSIRNIFNPAHS